jgi:hypothetical protein
MLRLLRCLLMIALTVIAFNTSSFAEEEKQGPTDAEVLDKCLRAWKKNPFRQNPDYRKLKAGVKILGVGGAVEDNEITKSPQLILVEPSVSVLTKSTLKLMNPQGWYCLKSKVEVLSATNIELHCQANLATSGGQVTILGSDTRGQGVTVLGKSTITRVGCPEEPAATPAPAVTK